MIGDLAQQRGKFEEAVRDFQAAADTTSRLLKVHPDDPQRIFDQSQSEFWVGYVQWYRGHLHEAEAAFRRYLDMARRMNEARPGDHDWQLEDVFAKTNVGIVLTEEGHAAEALPLLTQAREQIAQIARRHPEDAVSEGNTIGWVAVAYAALGRDRDAIQADTDKIAAAMRAPNADKDQDAQFLVANAHDELAKWHRNLGHVDQAIDLGRQALDELLALNAHDPSNVDTIAEIVSTQAVLAGLLGDQGQHEAARAQLDQARTRLAALMARPIPKRAWRITHSARAAAIAGRLADTEAERAAAAGALAAFRADLHSYELDGGVVPELDATLIAEAALVEGDLLARAGHPEQARGAWQSALVRIRSVAERRIPAAMTLLGQLDLRLGGIQDARLWADRVQGTTYRHPAFADLQQRLGPTRQAGGAARP
jgi:tetratricopeptide (TPR) repeat protein